MSTGAQLYKIRLESGRVLGPLDIGHVQRLVEKNRILGIESARRYPSGEWENINLITEIADLLLAKLEGKLRPADTRPGGYRPLGLPQASPQPLDATLPPDSQIAELMKQKLPSPAPVPVLAAPILKRSLAASDDDQDRRRLIQRFDLGRLSLGTELSAMPVGSPPVELETRPPVQPQPLPYDEDRSSKSRRSNARSAMRIIEAPERTHTEYENTSEVTQASRAMGIITRAQLKFFALRDGAEPTLSVVEEVPAKLQPVKNIRWDIAHERTVVFQRSDDGFVSRDRKKKLSRAEALRATVIAIAIGLFGYDFVFTPEKPSSNVARLEVIRPALPINAAGAKSDPEQSQQLYKSAMSDYAKDTVSGYRTAAKKLLEAAQLDQGNVKAMAMLASSYLNLIDSSNKDENYFSVISKLIELSRAKSIDLAESVIADVEFFITANKTEAAQQRIVEYTKSHRNFEAEMFYYIAYVFSARGDLQSAARYVALYPENKVFSPKVFHLRGEIAERLNDFDTAAGEYEKALKLYPSHARSHLKLAELMARRGELKKAGTHLKFIAEHPQLLPPKELARGYFLYAQYNELSQKWDIALGYVERAVVLDRENHDYLFELYTLRARLGDTNQASARKQARMYSFLGEGEKLLSEGKYHEALAKFLEARESDLDSPWPAAKIGDMFVQLNDTASARMNYAIAAKNTEKLPDLFSRQHVRIWSRHIETLVKSYEWDEARKAMEKFRRFPFSASAVARLNGDMFSKQGNFKEALKHYQKAMSQDTIDPSVYNSYANTLVAMKNFKDAPFFYALALRFDPTNIEALIGTAKCIASAESVDRGIALLQDHLQKSTAFKAELLAAIAELQMQRGEWTLAQQYIQQASEANPDYALPWKLQAQIYLNMEGLDKKALDKALASFKSFSDRNRSDPSGYLERYRLFIKKSEYAKAEEELVQIYSIYPHYPNLHYFKGLLYSTMRNPKLAIEEFQTELKSDPSSVATLVALGKELIGAGVPQEALPHLNKAIGISPGTPEPKAHAAYANYLLKNYAGSVALFNAALAYDKGNPMLYKRLGLAYQAMGDPSNAKTSFRKYLEMEPDAPDRGEFERFL